MTNERLDQALRENRRRRQMPKFLDMLKQSTGLGAADIVFLPAPGKELLQNVEAKLRQARVAGSLTSQAGLSKDQLESRLHQLVSRWRGRQILLILCHWVEIGAFCVTADLLSAKLLMDLLHFDGDVVLGATSQMDLAFLLDLDGDSATYSYEGWSIS